MWLLEHPLTLTIWPWFAAALIGCGATVSYIAAYHVDRWQRGEPREPMPGYIVAAYFVGGICQSMGGAIIGWTTLGTPASIIGWAFTTSSVNRATYRAAMETRFAKIFGGRNEKRDD